MHTLKRTSSLESVNAGNRWFGRRQGAKRVGWGVQHSSVLSASATLEKVGTGAAHLSFVTYAFSSSLGKERRQRCPLLPGKRATTLLRFVPV